MYKGQATARLQNMVKPDAMVSGGRVGVRQVGRFACRRGITRCVCPAAAVTMSSC